MVKFEVGQKVICVDASHTNTHDVRELEGGKIYTVSWVGPYTHPRLGTGICVSLQEGPRVPLTYEDGSVCESDMPFAARRFRPVKTTSVEVFKKLLSPTPETVDG